MGGLLHNLLHGMAPDVVQQTLRNLCLRIRSHQRFLGSRATCLEERI